MAPHLCLVCLVCPQLRLPANRSNHMCSHHAESPLVLYRVFFLTSPLNLSKSQAQ